MRSLILSVTVDQILLNEFYHFKRKLFRAGKVDRVDLEVEYDQRSVQSDQPQVKRVRINSEASEDFGLVPL